MNSKFAVQVKLYVLGCLAKGTGIAADNTPLLLLLVTKTTPFVTVAGKGIHARRDPEEIRDRAAPARWTPPLDAIWKYITIRRRG